MFTPNIPNIMQLHVWPSDFGLPSVDTECLQCMVAAKLCAAPIKFIYSSTPWKSPSGTFPCLDANKFKITKFEEFVDFLRSTQQDVVLDNDLIPAQLSEFDAYNCLLRQKLLPALIHLLWVDHHNFSTVTNYWYSSKIGLIYGNIYLERRRRKMKAFASATGKDPSKLIIEAIQVLNLLSAKLSDNKYFCGDKPCSMDALIFGYLAPLLRIPMPNDRLQLHMASCPNLVRFVEAIISIYLPLSEAAIREQMDSKRLWAKRKADAQKSLEDGRIRQEQKKTERELSKDSSIRDTVLFAMGAVTLSVLFAAHTGIIQFTTASAR